MLAHRGTIDSFLSVIRYIRNYSVNTTRKPPQFLASHGNHQSLIPRYTELRNQVSWASYVPRIRYPWSFNRSNQRR